MKDKTIEETLLDFATQLFVQHNILSNVTITSSDIHHRLRTSLGHYTTLHRDSPITLHAPVTLIVVKKDEN